LTAPEGRRFAWTLALAFAALARAMRRSGAKDTGGAVALLLVVAGGFGTIAVARLQLFSLALFGVLLAILHDRPARRRLWWLPALFALWANLHGGVLVGLGVAALYLAAEELRVRPRHALGIFAASVAAVLLATPALFRTPEYFLGVMRSEAAVHGEGLWAPLSTAPLDVVLVVAAVLLAAAAWRGRPRAWEVLAVLALAALTVHTARSGIWLVMALSVPAARGIGLRLRLRPGAGAIVAGVLVAAVVYGLVRGPLPFGAGGGAVPVALAAAGGGPILAQDVFAEQVVAAGGTIVLGNPLDAFSLEDQRLYLDWTSGRPGGDPLLRRAHVALVRVDSGAAARLVATGRFRELRRFGGLAVYVDATAGRGS